LKRSGSANHAADGATESALSESISEGGMRSAAYRAALDTDIRATPVLVRASRAGVVIFHILTIWLAAILVMPWLSRSRQCRMSTRFAKRMLRGLSVEVRIVGTPPSARHPIIFVANHVSWLDAHLLNLVGGARFIAKQEVASYPIFGTIVRQFGALFIRRGCIRDAYRVQHEAALTLSKGEHIAFFPEGTTSRGDRLNFFYPALFQTAVDTGATVQPLAIRWHHADGRLNFDAAFIDDLTVVDSIMLMLRHRVLYAEVNPVRSARGCRRFAAGIGVSHARGDREKTRSQLSRRARAACRGKF
jgi:1-acyl-sn-glycerol-3-phosphate acyltransferase